MQLMILMTLLEAVKSLKRLSFSLFLLTIFAHYQPLAAAQGHPFPMRSYWGPTAIGLGGAMAAAATNQDSFLTNPAGLANFTNISSVGGHYLMLPRSLSSFGASIVDGARGIVGGFQYSWTNLQQAARQNFVTGAAYRTPYGAAGVTVSAFRFSKLNPAAGQGWLFSGSVGVLVPVGMGLTLGAYSLHPFDNVKDSYLPPSLHLGAAYTYPEIFRISFEAYRRFKDGLSNWNYSLGGDVLIKQYFIFRGGYHWNNSREDNFGSIGLGITSGKLEISGVYTRYTSGKHQNGLGTDLTLRF